MWRYLVLASAHQQYGSAAYLPAAEPSVQVDGTEPAIAVAF